MDKKGADLLVIYNYKPYFIDVKSKFKNQFYHDFKIDTFYLEYDEYGFINMRNFLEKHPKVVEFTDAPPKSGGFGAKIVKL